MTDKKPTVLIYSVPVEALKTLNEAIDLKVARWSYIVRDIKQLCREWAESGAGSAVCTLTTQGGHVITISTVSDNADQQESGEGER